jgi:thioester reductase-like protein
MTGFPGFLGSALLPRLLARREDLRAVCLVQPHHMATARQRVSAMSSAHPGVRGRIELTPGDITAPDLGVGRDQRAVLEDVSEVWHLAAVYDLAVDLETARRVNVDGTERVLEFCRSRSPLLRLHYTSTCYVSGRYEGTFTEEALAEGQTFRNHYESTKYEAEVLVRKAMADGLPSTVYRPGIVVGDSRTGETQKFDGPYFFASYLQRLPLVALVPRLADPDVVKFSVVPRDFVIAAMDALSGLDRSVGRVYALTDPNPPTVRQLVDTFAGHLGKRVVWVRLPLGPTRWVVGSVPGIERLSGLPAEALDYAASPTTYSTVNTVADLAGTGVDCPPFESYAGTLLDFMRAHPEISSRAMV